MTELTWLGLIDRFGYDDWTRDVLVTEAQRTCIAADVPAELHPLKGGRFLDLGFQHLGLTKGELLRLRLAFCGVGVAVPGTPFRLRNARPLVTVVEPAAGAEAATLPPHWRRGVLVHASGVGFDWLGKGVPADLLAGVGPPEYEDEGDGWRRVADPPPPTPG